MLWDLGWLCPGRYILQALVFWVLIHLTCIPLLSIMNKKHRSFLVGLLWLVSLAAFFSPPPSSDLQGKWEDGQSTVQESISPEVYFFVFNDLPKTPSFSVDRSVWSKFNSDWVPVCSATGIVSVPSSFFKKSHALFDVKETFMHYFYTW